MKTLRNFFYEEDGIATIEMVLILCILVIVALLFKNAIKGFFQKISDAIDSKLDDAIQ